MLRQLLPLRNRLWLRLSLRLWRRFVLMTAGRWDPDNHLDVSRVPDSRAPSMRCQSGRLLGQCELICIPSEIATKTVKIIIVIQTRSCKQMCLRQMV